MSCEDTLQSVHHPLTFPGFCAILKASREGERGSRLTTSNPSLVNRKAELNHSTNCPPPLDFRSILCHTTYMLNRSHLISALYHEYQFLCHDDFDPAVDPTPDEYLAQLQRMSDDELRHESLTDSDAALDDFITTWL